MRKEAGLTAGGAPATTWIVYGMAVRCVCVCVCVHIIVSR